MIKNSTLAIAICSLTVSSSVLIASPVDAKSQNWTVKTKYGDEVSVRDGWFGTGKTLVKTNKTGKIYESKRGLFGNQQSQLSLLGGSVSRKKGWLGRNETDVSFIGNSVTRKKGLFGSQSTEVKTVFGDTIKTKKGWFGRTTTEIEPGGLSSMLSSIFRL